MGLLEKSIERGKKEDIPLILFIAALIIGLEIVNALGSLVSLIALVVVSVTGLIALLKYKPRREEDEGKELEYKRRKLEGEVYSPIIDEIPEVLESIRKRQGNIFFKSIKAIYQKTPWHRLNGTDLLAQLNQLLTDLKNHGDAWEAGRKYCQELIDNNFSKFQSKPETPAFTGGSTVFFTNEFYPLFIDANINGLKEKVQKVLRNFRENLVNRFELDGLGIKIYLTKKDQLEQGMEKTFSEFIESKERNNLIEAANKLDDRIYLLQKKLRNLINRTEELTFVTSKIRNQRN